MLRRLLVGLLLGLVVGGLIAAGLIKGLGMDHGFVDAGGAVLAYLFAALTGAVTGLVAGKPIWSRGAQIEAGLKAIFGALLAAGGMFALRQWGSGLHLNLTAIGAGDLPFGTNPAEALPLIAGVLGSLFGLDNTGGEAQEADTKKPDKQKPASSKAAATKVKARVAAEEVEEESLDVASKRAKR